MQDAPVNFFDHRRGDWAASPGGGGRLL